MSSDNTQVRLKRKSEPAKVMEAAGNAQKSNRSKIWILGIAGLAVLGAWALFSTKNSSEGSDNTEVRTTSSPANNSVPDEAPAGDAQNTDPNAVPTGNSNAIATGEKSNPNSENAPGNVVAGSDGKANASKSFAEPRIPVSFGKASAHLIQVDKSVVSEIVAYLEQNPKAKVLINGYASSEGNMHTNQVLSEKRAIAFKSFLTGKGISSARIVVAGKGSEKPLASNDTEEGRSKNRRVEVIIE